MLQVPSQLLRCDAVLFQVPTFLPEELYQLSIEEKEKLQSKDREIMKNEEYTAWSRDQVPCVRAREETETQTERERDSHTNSERERERET